MQRHECPLEHPGACGCSTDLVRVGRRRERAGAVHGVGARGGAREGAAEARAEGRQRAPRAPAAPARALRAALRVLLAQHHAAAAVVRGAACGTTSHSRHYLLILVELHAIRSFVRCVECNVRCVVCGVRCAVCTCAGRPDLRLRADVGAVAEVRRAAGVRAARVHRAAAPAASTAAAATNNKIIVCYPNHYPETRCSLEHSHKNNQSL